MSSAPNRIRVAHVTGEMGFSGGEVQVFLLLEGLRERGHESLLICRPDSASEREALRRGIDVESVPMRNEASLLAIGRIARTLHARRPDIVHCHTGRANWLGGVAARACRVPAVTTRRMDRRVKRGPRTRWLYGQLMRRAAAISPAVERRLLDAGVDGSRVRVIWSAVDPESLEPSAPRDALRASLGVEPDVACLLVAAALVRRKGIDVLLDAFATVTADPLPVLWIAGDGPERGALESRAKTLGADDRVHFLGRREDVADLLEACDVFVLPSRLEGLGVAALEAMARRRAVVATRVGGLAETVVDEVTGLLVEPDDAPALGAALTRLVADADLRRRLGEEGAARVAEGYLAEQMVAAYETLYREVLDTGDRR